MSILWQDLTPTTPALEDQRSVRKYHRTSQLEQQLRSLSISVSEWKSEPELCSLTFGTIQISSKRTTMDVDSGAEFIVWPPELLPEVATIGSAQSRRGVKYFGPGDKITPTLPILASFTTVSRLSIFSGKHVSTLCQCGNHC